MAIETQKFIRKPLYVDAVRITPQNFDAIVSWCQGEVMQDDVPGRGRSKKYIKVDVHNPKNPRQTKAKLGDWILKTDKGYKIYTDKAFHESFHTLEEDARNTYVINNFGDTPEAVQLEAQRNAGLIPASEEVVPGVTVSEAIRILRHHADLQTAVGPDVELVPATPESIAQAVNENEARIRQGLPAVEYPEETTIGGTPREEINVGGSITMIDEDEALTVGVGEQPDNVETVPEQETVVPAAAEGKRVLSIDEQNEMDADEIRDLIKSGEVILAQDIAA